MAKIGAEINVIIAASEEYLNRAATANHITMAASPNKTENPINTPIPVATPLPPLNPNQIGKQWPTIAPPAAKIAISGPYCTPNTTANTPLPPSRIKVAAARDLRPVLRTFVAPIFPEPTLRISPCPANHTSSNPNGIDPTIYPSIADK